MTPRSCISCTSWFAAGATIVGPRPTKFTEPAALSGMRTRRWRVLATDLWGDMDGVTLNQQHLRQGHDVLGHYAGRSSYAAEERAGLCVERIAGTGLWMGPPGLGASAYRRNAEIYFWWPTRPTRRYTIDAALSRERKDVQIWRPMNGAIDRRQPGYTSRVHVLRQVIWRTRRAIGTTGYWSPAVIEPHKRVSPRCPHEISPEPPRVPSSVVFLATPRPRLTASASVAIEKRKLATLGGRGTLSFPGELGARQASVNRTAAHVVGPRAPIPGQVLLRHRYLHQDGAGPGVVVQAGATHLDDWARCANRRGQGERQAGGVEWAPPYRSM